MKIKILLLVIFSVLLGINPADSQTFIAPSPGKAVVYIVRFSDNGLTTSIEYFHQDKYIGIFKGKDYMRYECDPGKNLFWASCENKDFVTADLKEGRTYILIVDIYTGAIKHRVKLIPVTEKDTELFRYARKLINSRPPVVTPKSKIDHMNIQLADFIATRLDQYETDWKFTNDYRKITPEMNISLEAMK